MLFVSVSVTTLKIDDARVKLNDPNDLNDLNDTKDLNDTNDLMTGSFADD